MNRQKQTQILGRLRTARRTVVHGVNTKFRVVTETIAMTVQHDGYSRRTESPMCKFRLNIVIKINICFGRFLFPLTGGNAQSNVTSNGNRPVRRLSCANVSWPLIENHQSPKKTKKKQKQKPTIYNKTLYSVDVWHWSAVSSTGKLIVTRIVYHILVIYGI